MSDVVLLGLKAVNGGVFVVAFSAVAEVLSPKRFSGIFSAAPSVALANLLVVLLVKGKGEGASDGIGMIVGGVAMAIACLAGIWLVRRWGAGRGSAGVCAAWLAIAELGYLAVLR